MPQHHDKFLSMEHVISAIMVELRLRPGRKEEELIEG